LEVERYAERFNICQTAVLAISLDGGFEGVIEVAAVVIKMSRVLVGADLDCEATSSNQSSDTRIARRITSYVVSSCAVIVESSFDGN